MKKQYWQKAQIKTFVRDLRERLGDGWRFMTPEVRIAFVEAKALNILRMQAREAVDVAAMDELVLALLAEAKLAEE